MAISTRDVLVVIRARDVASRVVRQVGTSFRRASDDAMRSAQRMMDVGAALTSVGVGIGVVGASGLAFVKQAAEGTAEYNQLAARTLTQVDDLSVTVEDLASMARRIALEIPKPAEELQKTLFFIFSTMDVNVKEAEHLLRNFARESVAGMAEIEDAARTTIAILNAFQIPVEDVSRVTDTQFQIIRKGAITYDELSQTIGLAIPAAVRAGQSFETLGGMMAFLTKNGLTASRAATSSARALEAFTHTKTISRLEEMGIKTRDVSGEFLPLVEIIRGLSGELKSLPKPERIAILEDLFRGSGSRIQARRFIDLSIQNFDEFEKQVNHMENAEGVFDRAYDIMRDQPASDIQLLANAWQELRFVFGNEFLPLLIPTIEQFTLLLQKIADMDPQLRKNIAKWFLMGSSIAVVVGAVLTMAGAFLMLEGIMKIAFGKTITGLLAGPFIALIKGFGSMLSLLWTAIRAYGVFKGALLGVKAVGSAMLAAIGGPITLIIAAVLALVAAFIYFWRTSESFRNFWKRLWTILQGSAVQAWHWIQDAARSTWDFLQRVFKGVVDWIDKNLVPVWQLFARGVQIAWKHIKKAAGVAWDFLRPIFNLLKAWVVNIVIPMWKALWKAAKTSWSIIKDAVQFAWRIMKGIFNALVRFIFDFLGPTFRWLWQVVKVVWHVIMMIIRAAWHTHIKPIFQGMKWFIRNVLGPIFSWLWHSHIKPTWNAIKTAIVGIWHGNILPVFRAIRWAINKIVIPAIRFLGRIWGQIWGGLSQVISKVWAGIKRTIGNAVNIMIGMIEGFLNDLVDAMNFVGGILNKIPGAPQIDRIGRVYLGRVPVRSARSAPTSRPTRGGVQAGLQHGGTVTRSGLVWTGEKGPELSYMEAGTRVLPSDLSRELAGGGGDQYHFHLHSNGEETAEQMFKRFVEEIGWQLNHGGLQG